MSSAHMQVPVAISRILSTVVPGLSRLQDEVASPMGTAANCHEIPLEIAV